MCFAGIILICFLMSSEYHMIAIFVYVFAGIILICFLMSSEYHIDSNICLCVLLVYIILICFLMSSEYHMIAIFVYVYCWYYFNMFSDVF